MQMHPTLLVGKLRGVGMMASCLVIATLGAAHAAPVYLNDQNITVVLGASHGASNPFANVSLAQSLANIIDAPSAAASELHNQSTHVWVSGGHLELDFDFGVEYDLTTLHFWNYHSEAYDVDDIVFTFYDSSYSQVGLLNVQPLLGNATGSDSDPLFAEDYALNFPSNVQYVNALLTGTNGQVDFNNIGFTAVLSDPDPDPDPGPGPNPVPEPTSLALIGIGLAGFGLMRRRQLHSGTTPS